MPPPLLPPCCPIWCCLSRCHYLCHVLVPSSCCDLHSLQCTAYNVPSCFVHPVCLVSVSQSISDYVRVVIHTPPAVNRCGKMTAYCMAWQKDIETNTLRFISSDQLNIYNVINCMSVLWSNASIALGYIIIIHYIYIALFLVLKALNTVQLYVTHSISLFYYK